MPTNDLDDYLSAAEARRILQCDSDTLYRYAKRQRRIRTQGRGKQTRYHAADVRQVAAAEQAEAEALTQLDADAIFAEEVTAILGGTKNYPYVLAERQRLTTRQVGGRVVFSRQEVEQRKADLALSDALVQARKEREQRLPPRQSRRTPTPPRQPPTAQPAREQRPRHERQRERDQAQAEARARRAIPVGYLSSAEARRRLGDISRQGLAYLVAQGHIRTRRAEDARTIGYHQGDVEVYAAHRYLQEER